jgi:hypothetical protein
LFRLPPSTDGPRKVTYRVSVERRVSAFSTPIDARPADAQQLGEACGAKCALISRTLAASIEERSTVEHTPAVIRDADALNFDCQTTTRHFGNPSALGGS